METNNTLNEMATEIATKTGCPIEVARAYVRAFLDVIATPEGQAEVLAAIKAVR